MLKLNENKSDLIASAILLLFTLCFFSRLFIPKLSVLYTVEPIGSDLLGVNYPAREFYSKEIKNFQVPFWDSSVGSGFAILGEGQIGAFYLPNLIFFKLFPMAIALNLSYIFAFICLATGTYFFAKSLGISRRSSVLASISFTFSGYFIARMVHISPLLTMSLMPWVFYSADRIWESRKLPDFLFFIFIASEQIFAGHLQWVFITYLGYFIYKLPRAFFFSERGKAPLTKEVARKLFNLLLGIVVVAGVVSIQLLPSLEYFKQSGRQSGLSEANYNSEANPFINLYRFINPSYFGFDKFQVTKVIPEAGLTWEEEVYIGILPILMLLVLFIRKKDSTDISLIILLLIALVLSFGKYTPFGVIERIPPLKYFRIPSRYLVLVSFSICLLAGRSLDFVFKRFLANLKNKTRSVIFLSILIFVIFDLVKFGYNYHSFVSAKDAFAPPQVTNFIKEGQRVFADSSATDLWRSTYAKYGYGGSEAFLFLKNLLLPSFGELWGIPSALNSYGYNSTRYPGYNLINDKVLDIDAVDFVTSAVAIDGSGYEKVAEFTSDKNNISPIYLYKNTDKLERARVQYKYKILNSVNDVRNTLEKGLFDEDTVLLEKNDKTSDLGELTAGKNTIQKLNESNLEVSFKLTTSQEGIFVLADSYYPQWKAYVNGNEVTIFPANLNQRAIIIPAGESEVVFKYDSKSYRNGKLITIVTIFATALVASIILFKNRISKTKSRGKASVRGKKDKLKHI